MSLLLFIGQGAAGNVASVPLPEPSDAFQVSKLVGASAAYAGAIFATDGWVYALQYNGNSTKVGRWLNSGENTSFWISRTIDSGTLTNLDAGAGPLALTTSREYSQLETVYANIDTATVSFSISTDVSGTPVVATGTYVISAELGPST